MNKTFLIVSHDRFFLSKIANKVTEIEDKKFVNYSCNYKVYLKKRELHREVLAKKYHSTEKERTRLETSVKEKREWAHKNGSKKLKIIADRLEKNANDLEYAPDPKGFDSNFKLEFKNSVLGPEIVFLGSLANKKFEDKVIFENSDFEINNGDKVAIIGKNGAGKSTLLKIFNGDSPDSFEKFKIAKGLEIGYFDQEFANLDLNQSVMDFLWGVNEKLLEHEVISTAIKFGIPKAKINTKIKALSGGEKTRISIVALMLKKTNLLLLDEPTNHLDTNLIESLEKALKDYSGTIIFISHDRFFIDRVANKVIYINKGKLESYIGNYSQNF